MDKETKLYARRLLTPAGWREDQVITIRDGVIQGVESGHEGDLRAEIAAPGLFDVHCHGGAGYTSHRTDPDRLAVFLDTLASCGVTDVLLTVGTASTPDPSHYASVLGFIRDAMARQARGELGGAAIRGVHMEGPFLSPDRRGAMDPAGMLALSPETWDQYFGAYEDIIRLVTIAPERDGARALAAHLLGKGLCLQAGHTDATADQADEAFSWGVDSLCHTFNAARPIHHRDPGIVAAALLNDSVFCETICDLKHLYPHTVKLIYRMKGPDRMVAISDAGIATALPDGEHVIDGRTYLVVDGTQRVNGGNTLSGGACYLDGSVRNLISLGIPAEHALRIASRTPAMRLRMPRTGLIVAGAPAHIAAFDEKMRCAFTLIGQTVSAGA